MHCKPIVSFQGTGLETEHFSCTSTNSSWDCAAEQRPLCWFILNI